MISVRERVAITLYRLADKASYRTVSNLFGVGKSTVCQIIMLEVCTCIVEVLFKRLIHLPVRGGTFIIGKGGGGGLRPERGGSLIMSFLRATCVCLLEFISIHLINLLFRFLFSTARAVRLW